MKKIIDGIIVVEGKTDVDFLSSYIDAEFVITNGSAISEDTINYLMNANKQIYVLTDPDFPGMKIRGEIAQKVMNVKHVFIKKENSIKNGKVGVAEGDIKEILDAFENVYEEKSYQISNITMSDLVDLGFSGARDSDEKRQKVSEKLHLGYCNAKTFLKRLNSKGITLEDLKKLC